MFDLAQFDGEALFDLFLLSSSTDTTNVDFKYHFTLSISRASFNISNVFHKNNPPTY